MDPSRSLLDTRLWLLVEPTFQSFLFVTIPLQGVNSALEDVVELDQALGDCGGDLERALPLFEERRMPNVEALVQLVAFCYPYQV